MIWKLIGRINNILNIKIINMPKISYVLEGSQDTKENNIDKSKLRRINRAIAMAVLFSILDIIIAIPTIIKDISDSYIYSLLSLLVFLWLTIWLYKKSKVAAVILLAYSVLLTITNIISWEITQIPRIIFMVFLDIIYLRWLLWVLKYHNLKHTKNIKTWEIILGICNLLLILVVIIWEMAQ